MKWTLGVAAGALAWSLTAWAQADNSTEQLAVEPIKLPTFIDIAHRGASGYLPEHSQAATVMAYALGADYIEQDIQLSRDGKAVVLHDVQLDAISNVKEVFPERHRPDGSYYVVDFTLNHLKQLKLTSRKKSDGAPQYPERFQNDQVEFKIQTLAESLNLVQELNRVRGEDTGVYIEVKAARWYRDQDYDPLAVVMNVLSKNGYSDKQQATPIYLQSFDPETLRRVKREFHCDFPLVQLIADNSWAETSVDYDALRTYAGMESLTSYADHVGLWLGHVLKEVKDGEPVWTDVLANAKKVGLKVHVYTLRADQLPEGVESLKQLRGWLKEAGVEGVFSDFPDQK